MSRRAESVGRLVGAALLGLVLLASALPLALELDPARQDLSRTLAAPSAAHPLGTDHLGRDMLARLAHGARLSLSLALLCVGAAVLGGTALALAAAWWGGWVDRALSLVADAVLALPGLLLILLLAALAPGRPAFVALGIALARVLALAPAIILAHEPTSRLDLLTRRRLMETLGKSAARSGAAVVLVTHDPDIASRWADRVVALRATSTASTPSAFSSRVRSSA